MNKFRRGAISVSTVTILIIVIPIAILIILSSWVLEPGQIQRVSSVYLPEKPKRVFEIIDQISESSKWPGSIIKVERVQDERGNPAICLVLTGGARILTRTVERRPPLSIVRTFQVDGGPYLGSWTFEIDSHEQGAQLTVKESLVGRSLFDRLFERQVTFMPAEQYLEDLVQKAQNIRSEFEKASTSMGGLPPKEREASPSIVIEQAGN